MVVWWCSDLSKRDCLTVNIIHNPACINLAVWGASWPACWEELTPASAPSPLIGVWLTKPSAGAGCQQLTLDLGWDGWWLLAGCGDLLVLFVGTTKMPRCVGIAVRLKERAPKWIYLGAKVGSGEIQMKFLAWLWMLRTQVVPFPCVMGKSFLPLFLRVVKALLMLLAKRNEETTLQKPFQPDVRMSFCTKHSLSRLINLLKHLCLLCNWPFMHLNWCSLAPLLSDACIWFMGEKAVKRREKVFSGTWILVLVLL